MKERFPRVVGGFSVGFLIGGLLGIPLLALLGSTKHLLLGATVAQLAFLGLLLETERRFPEVRAAPVERSQEMPGRRRERCSRPGSFSCCSSTRCCRPWGRGWPTTCSSTARTRTTAGTT